MRKFILCADTKNAPVLSALVAAIGQTVLGWRLEDAKKTLDRILGRVG